MEGFVVVQNKNLVNRAFYPWLIWALGAGFFFAEYLARIAPGVMVPQLMHAFNVTALGIGSMSAFFYYAYLSMQIPVGTMVDRWGPHRLLTFMALLCAAGCFLFAFATNLTAAHLARFMMGFGAAFAFVGTLKLATLWFSPKRFGLLAGLTQALGMLGAAFAGGPLAALVNKTGWRNTMMIIGIGLLLLGLLIGLFARDKKESFLQTSTRLPKQNLWHAFFLVLKNPQSWWNALYVGLLYAPSAAFAELWGVSFLVRTYGLSTDVAASAVSCIFLGWAVGGPIIGALSDRMGKRRPLMICSIIFSFVFMTAVLYLPLTTTLLFIFLFCYGVSNTGVALSYAVASEINPRAVAGTSMAFANMASVLIGAAFQPIIGWILDLQWHGEMLNGTPFYSPAAYRIAMLALPACLIIGLLIIMLVKETHCRIKEVKIHE